MAKLLRKGSTGQAVTNLQKLLVDQGYLVIENESHYGHFGPKTEQAVRKFQSDKDLMVDGVVGDGTWTVLKDNDQPYNTVKESTLKAAAEQLDVDVNLLKAIRQIESRGNPTAVLFERHIFFRMLVEDGYGVLAAILERVESGICNRKPGGYRGGVIEHDRLKHAMDLNREAGAQSASYGDYQLMGFHWKRLGFKSPLEMKNTVLSMNSDEQIQLLVKFIQTDLQLLNAFRKKSFSRIAEIYNGPAYRKNSYDTKLRTAYLSFRDQEV